MVWEWMQRWNGGTVAAPEASEKHGMGQKHGMRTERQVEMDPLLVDDECFAYLLAQWVLSRCLLFRSEI